MIAKKFKHYNTDTRLEKWSSGLAVTSSPGPRCRWRWARQVVEAEGAQVEGSGRSGAGSCPQSITRENKKFKKLNTTKLKSKRKENKEKQAPGPPPYLFWVRPCFGQMVRGARRSCAELAHLEAGRPEQLDTRRTTSVHAGNVASRMQTKARACQQNFCRSSSLAASTCTEKRARACRGASNACCVAVRQPESSRRASVVQGGVCVGSQQTGSTSLFYL